MMHCIILSSHCIDKLDELVKQQSLIMNGIHQSKTAFRLCGSTQR